jgi:hypothetical protein
VGGAAALGCSAWSNVDEFLNERLRRAYTQSAPLFSARAVTGDSHSASLSLSLGQTFMQIPNREKRVFL